MTKEEKAQIQLETRLECARIAALESHYWAGLDDSQAHMADISIGAMGASANICGALFMGKTEEEVREEIARRGVGLAAEAGDNLGTINRTVKGAERK